MAVSVFGFTQIIVHGFLLNIKGKCWYNPGLFTTFALFLPLGVMYFMQVADVATTKNYIIGILVAPVLSQAVAMLPIKIFQKRHSPYAFTPENTRNFDLVQRYLAKMK